MKTKFLSVAVLASAVTIAYANPVAYHGGGGRSRPGGVAHTAPAARAPGRGGGFSSFHSMPTRSFAGGMPYPRQAYSSSGMRSYRSAGFRQPSTYPNGVTITRSGPYTAATIGQPGNRFPRYANHRSPATTSVWNQRNTGSQFRNGNSLRNGNNRLRGDWQKHVFAQQSGDWHRDWNRHSDHWWNGHRCCFINGSWVIFNVGFYPWWPYWGYPNDYYYDDGFPYDGYGSSTYGYDYSQSYNYDPGSYDSGDYQGQMYYDQNGYPDQSQNYYDSTVYQTGAYYDPNGDSDQSYSNYSTVVAAQERLAREGYYQGESNGAFSAEMRQALRRYQRTNGLQVTGYLDDDTLAVMGLRRGASY